MQIYLSGGMRSDWQDRVMTAVPHHAYFDPRQNDTKIAQEYTFLDLMHIEHADLVFAYLESDNPSGLGLALEVGYALGLGKPVIFVSDGRKYVQIVEQAASILCVSLEQACGLLNRLQG